MIPVELILFLLDRLRAKGMEMVETPAGRDGFALGEVHGWMKCVAELRVEIEALIENRAGPDDRSSTSSGSNDEREYEF